jgi:zinc transport system permease protein
VGVLLIVAMLIIPAATARIFARTPEAMAIIAALIGSLSAFGGLEAAYIFDTPAGPTIVCAAAISFATFNIVGYLYKKIS